MRPFRPLAFVLLLALGCTWATAADDAPPIESGLHESVEIRLVTVDVVALDTAERTVSDLTKADFKLLVDGREMPIDTLDVRCDGGAADDPKSKRFGQWATPADLSSGTRRVVLAFDYLHLASTQYSTMALQEFQRTLSAKTGVRDEEMMVVALGGGLRVEQPFTKDRDAVVATLRRMEHDISLWNGNFSHLTELPLFAGLESLVTVLHSVEGPTAVVFLTAGRGPGRRYQLEFEHLAAAANDAKVAFYPVDLRGMEGPT
jgi:VWFA-related protein